MNRRISADLLEKTCKDAIETILFCLEHATKGTIYLIGPMPRLQAIRITSGVRDGENGKIVWGLPEISDYNPPGKSWEQYRDRSGHPLEAMGWCVEHQKSWTADNPYEDTRSIRRQICGEPEGCYHMEPVLVRKADLDLHRVPSADYPSDWFGNAIWQGTDYIVVAVIKIHFLPQTVYRGDRSTKIIKKLSRTLGTELLSLHVREIYLEAKARLARERLQSCNVLADGLRNTLTKLGFVFSAINAVVSFLREQWEKELMKAFPDIPDKRTILERLSELLFAKLPQLGEYAYLDQISRQLLAEQDELKNLFVLPEKGKQWIQNRVRSKWNHLLSETKLWNQEKGEIEHLLEQLEEAVRLVVDESLAGRVVHLSEDLRALWPKIAYTEFSAKNIGVLEQVSHLLDHSDLVIPHKQQLKKILKSLKILVEVISKLERQVNEMMCSLKAGGELEGETN